MRRQFKQSAAETDKKIALKSKKLRNVTENW